MRSKQRNEPTNASSRSGSSSSRTDSRRRHFLFAVGLGGAGAAALAARSLTGVAQEAASDDDAQTSKGYQVTDHVRRYYRTAKI